MASGIHSTISSLQTRLFLRWCPKWYGAFSDPKGGFYERLGKGFKPVFTGQRRLVTQCRQLAMYSHASLNNNKEIYKNLKAQFEFILNHYHDPQTGLWHFSLEDGHAVSDRTCDLYALTFVIFAFSHYFRATGDGRARIAAKDVLTLIDTKFRLAEFPGFAEALDERSKPLPKMRRQNPHMHLLEACVFAHEIWKDEAYEAMADEMVDIFHKYFFDGRSATLIEFFSNNLFPHMEKGSYLEPGHHFEWVWLLKKHAVLKGDPAMHDAVALRLLDWANTHGWDETYGGIYDTVSPEGRVIADTKRIWPFCEGLKANALMLTLAPDRQAIKDRVSAMVAVFERKYMQERGFWTEWLNRDLSPAADYMPGTTPYHVYFGITETLDVLERRGAMKSLGAKVDGTFYSFRRTLSHIVRKMRTVIAAG
jgi:mannose/cellobiose epimerase-like protein (N-acyl-D-glucosamine 2-epimerase family)